MRKLFSLCMTMVFVGMTVAACDNEEDGPRGNEGSAKSFLMKFTGVVCDSLTFVEDSIVKAAYTEAFQLSDYREPFDIEGKDSLEISGNLSKLCLAAEKKLENCSFTQPRSVTIYHQGEDSKNMKPVWYEKSYSFNYNFFSYINAKPFYKSSGYKYATEFMIQEGSFNKNGDSHWQVPNVDLNDGAGGEYLYMGIYFKDYDSRDIKNYITDVICVKSYNGLGADYTLKYNGRTYKMAQKYKKETQDLNKGAGGPYLYIMYTRDEYEGKYLVSCCSDFYFNGDLLINPFTYTGSAAETSGCTRLVYTSSIASESISYDDFNLTENDRIVPMVGTDGKKISDMADFNNEVGGEYIYMVGSYDILYPVSDYANWMKYVDDNTPICRMSIPGSHDTYTYNIDGGFGVAQKLDIDEQWNSGVRYFDMRPNGGYDITHSVLGTGWSVKSAIKKIKELLAAHPKDFAIVVANYEESAIIGSAPSDDWKLKLRELIKESAGGNDNLVVFKPDLKLKDVRGKILVIFRNKLEKYPYDEMCEPYGCVADGWSGTIDVNLHLYGIDPYTPAPLIVEDEYHPKDESADVKMEYFKQALETYYKTLSDDDNYTWCIAHTSCYCGADNNAAMAEEVQPMAYEYLRDHRGTPCGIIPCDFAGVNYVKQFTFGDHHHVAGRKLTDIIVQNNFIGK